MRVSSFVFLLLMISACGDGAGAYNTSSAEAPQTEDEVVPVDFSNRLSNQLFISGQHCNGSETIDIDGRQIVCASTQWLITIDNVNVCSPSGACTESEVNPIIGEVQHSENDSDPNYIYYEIVPRTEITIQQQNILDDVQVRSDLSGGNAIVIFK